MSSSHQATDRDAHVAAHRQRPIAAYGDQNLQAEFLDRLRLRYELGDDEWYAPQTRGEANTAANLFRRGWLIREKAGKRWVYKLAQPELRAL